MATNKKYKLTDGNMWATDGVYDFDQDKTQRQINSALNGAISAITPLDTAPTSGSTKGVTSGGVYTALQNLLATQTGTPVNPIIDASTIEIKKSGKIVYVVVGNVVPVSGTGTWIAYFSVPNGFKPPNTTRFFARDLASGTLYNGRVQTSGSVELNIPNGTTANAFFSVSYIIN